jgi:hypothetical protein
MAIFYYTYSKGRSQILTVSHDKNQGLRVTVV